MAIDIVKETTFKSIAVVISPLTLLMQDQVKFLKSVGLAAKFIGEDQNDEEANKALEKGDCQIVFCITGIILMFRSMEKDVVERGV